MTGRLGRFHNWVVATFETFAALILLLALLDMLLQVGGRTFFPRNAPAWTEEAARIALVWVTFIGASAATLRNVHLVVDLFSFSSAVVRRVWDIFIALAIVALSVALIYGGMILVHLSSRSATPGLGWPGSVYYVPLVIFAAAAVYSSLIVIAVNLLAILHRQPAVADEATAPADPYQES